MADNIENVLKRYFTDVSTIQISVITSGLINQTYRITIQEKKYILQSINIQVFKTPEIITSNILKVAGHLNTGKYPKQIVNLIANINGDYLTECEGVIWRLSTYINDTVCFEKVQSNVQAYEAAKALSEFHAHLVDFPIAEIQAGILGFLDYQNRVLDFNKALKNGNIKRLLLAEDEINFVQKNIELINKYLQINFPQRVVHADAKISNFLFHTVNSSQVAAIIDWDTILPGNILCDFGDMIRTYANLKAEDDIDSENNFSIENYQAVKQGFLFFLKDKLTDVELNSIDLTAKVVILIQAIRFLTDFLTNDIYYQITYENQNFNRTKNQLNLLQSLLRYT